MNKDYFIQNTFICTFDDEEVEYNLRKSKSCNDILSLKNDSNLEIKDLITNINQNLSDILFDLIIVDINNQIVNFHTNTIFELAKEQEQEMVLLGKINEEYITFTTINDLIINNSNNNNNYKQIIKLLKELSKDLYAVANNDDEENNTKLKDKLTNNSEIIKFLNINILNLETIYNYLNTKDKPKIKDHYMLKNELNNVNKVIIKSFLDLNKEYKTLT
jgi:mevalonate kinase